jgi:segregation and condensation protein B
LGIQPTDDPLAADIMVESHGKRLGLTQLIESLLFVSDEPVDAVQLAKALDVTLESVEAGLMRLDKLYHVTGRGLRLQAREGQYSLVTAPEAAGAIEDFLNLDLTTKLSGPALETLAVVAYRQPVTRLQIEAVRGVDCAGVLRSMTQRGLIEEVGRLETVGRPILYGVTDLFMQHFGLMDLAELPPLETQDEDMLWAATQLAALEDESRETEDATS